MSITLSLKLFSDLDGNPRLPIETDFEPNGQLSTEQYFLYLISMCYYKQYCDETNTKYDKFEISSKILICKTMLDLKIRTALASVNVNLVDTMCQMYDIKESENLRNHYDIIPGYMNSDGVPRVDLNSPKSVCMDDNQ